MEQEKQTYKIKIIPEFISGSSTHAVIKQQALKTLKKFQGLSNFTTTNGFTLIELLVVVLIIGILAAVAVPQYQRAVQKSRYATIKNVVKSIADAQEVYYLENGSYADSFEDLDVQIPPGYNEKRGSVKTRYYSWGVLQTSSSGQTFAKYDFPSFSVQYQIAGPHSTTAPHAGKTVCTALNTTDTTSAQAQFCQNDTGQTSVGRTGDSFLMYYFN